MNSSLSEPDLLVSSAAGFRERSSTPYLDRELPLPPSNPGYRRIRPWQTGLIVAIFLLRTPLEIYLLLLAAIFFHEVGHYSIGLLVGLEFNEIRVGPLALDRDRKFSWTWNWWTISTGHASMLPKGGSVLPLRLALYILGGPVANVVSGAVLFRSFYGGDSSLAGFVEVFAGGSFLLAFVNLIPLQRSGFSSDGMRLFMLLFSKKRKRWIFLLERQAAIKRGEGAPEADPTTIPTQVADGSSDHVESNWAAHMAAKSAKNDDLAAQHLEACLSKCSTATPEFREELILAAARFQAMNRKRIDLAWQWLNSSNPDKARINRACTEAVLLYCEGNRDQALTKIAEGEKLVRQMSPSPLRSRQEDAWKRLRQTFERAAESIAATSSDTHPSGGQP